VNPWQPKVLAALRSLEPILCIVLSLATLLAVVPALILNLYLLLVAVGCVTVLFSFHAVLGWIASRAPRLLKARATNRQRLDRAPRSFWTARASGTGFSDNPLRFLYLLRSVGSSNARGRICR
jgi:hypothetical protein